MRCLSSATLALLLLHLAALPAHAQDAAPATTTGDEPAPAETQPVAEPAAEPATAEPPAAPPASTAPAMPAPAPIMVIALGNERVPPETVAAVRSAIVAQIEPMTGGRPVLPLLSPELEAVIAACADAPCVGQQVGNAGAIGAIVARLARRTNRGPIDVRIEMIDPISGAARVEPIVYSLPADADPAQALAPLIEQLRGGMFAPPPPPPQIMVTVNVDGATVRIDDETIGESPVAAHQVTPGRHTVTVQRDGYMLFRRDIEADMGETERLDVTLQTLQSAGLDPAGVAGAEGAQRGPEWYEHWAFWTAVGGGVLLISGAIGIGIAVSSDQAPLPDPMGIQLPPIR